jgi:hypothetical protein
LAFSPGNFPSPDPHRSRLRRRAAGLSLLLHLLFLALLLWLPPPSFPGEYAITVRLALAGPPPPPEEPLPPPAKRAKREPPPEPPPKPQVKPTPTPSPSARSVQDSPRRPVGEARAKERNQRAPGWGSRRKAWAFPGKGPVGFSLRARKGKGRCRGCPSLRPRGRLPPQGFRPWGARSWHPLPTLVPLGKGGRRRSLGPLEAMPPLLKALRPQGKA